MDKISWDIKSLKQYSESDGHVGDLDDIIDQLEADIELEKSGNEYDCLGCATLKLENHDLKKEFAEADIDHLDWLYHRMRDVYHVDYRVDFMRRFSNIIAKARQKKT